MISDAGGLLKQSVDGAAAEILLDDQTQPQPLPADGGVNVVVNAGDGADTVTIATHKAQSATVDGGAGKDTITGSANDDVLRGGADNDHLIGADGDDRIIGDPGADDLDGGAGNDTLVWNNGDGSDSMDGNGLDRAEVNGAAGQGDAFAIAPNGARAKFDRTNLVPFTLDIGSEEALDVRGSGGDDSFTAQPGTGALLAVTADGGSGNDALTGAEEADSFFGGSGDDTLDAGSSPDLLDGQDGDDTLRSRDGQSDLVRGGAGTDSGVLDALGTDVWDSIENVDAPVIAPPPAPPAGDTTATAACGDPHPRRLRQHRRRLAHGQAPAPPLANQRSRPA